MKMSPVVHFELPAIDRDRMVEFYEKTFGWKSQKLGPEMGHYVLVQTCETAENGCPTESGRINGGLFLKTEDSKYPSVVIAVEDVREAMKKVETAGGKILGGQGGAPGEPDNIPGVGLYSAFIDTEGNRIGMLEPSKDM